MSARELGRLWRTVKQLHPLQVASRVPHMAIARAMAAVPSVLPPRARVFDPPEAPALATLAEEEKARGQKRLAHLPAGSRLRAYEAAYGLELGASGEVDVRGYKARVALEPYPASVRARRLATRIRLGDVALVDELARACRAVLPQLEVHLLANHLLENAFALVAGGAVTKGREADLWFSVGASLLDWQLPEQFMEDGGHFERTASYHVALTYALLEVIELARAGGREPRARWVQIARKAIRFMEAVRAPDGTYPLFNDAALDAAPRIDDVLRLARELGIEAGERPAPLVHLHDTGWILFRDGDTMLAFDAGADGASYQPGHVHADALTIELWAEGRRTIVDYGVSSYGLGEAREACRATRAHNTIELEGRDSSEVWAAFRVGRRARGRVHALHEDSTRTPHTFTGEASHDGYMFLPGRPVHTRTLALTGRELEVRDRIVRPGHVHGSGDGTGLSLVAVSRLRVAREARRATGLRVEDPTGEPLARRDDVWFEEHGVPAPAELFEQRAYLQGALDLAWRVSW